LTNRVISRGGAEIVVGKDCLLCELCAFVWDLSVLELQTLRMRWTRSTPWSPWNCWFPCMLREESQYPTQRRKESQQATLRVSLPSLPAETAGIRNVSGGGW